MSLFKDFNVTSGLAPYLYDLGLMDGSTTEGITHVVTGGCPNPDAAVRGEWGPGALPAGRVRWSECSPAQQEPSPCTCAPMGRAGRLHNGRRGLPGTLTPCGFPTPEP